MQKHEIAASIMDNVHPEDRELLQEMVDTTKSLGLGWKKSSVGVTLDKFDCVIPYPRDNAVCALGAIALCRGVLPGYEWGGWNLEGRTCTFHINVPNRHVVVEIYEGNDRAMNDSRSRVLGNAFALAMGAPADGSARRAL